MKVICAPDSFKESLSAAGAAAAMARGVQRAVADAIVDQCPIADGGEGTVDAMLAATGGQARTTAVPGPLGAPVAAVWGLLGRRQGAPDTAVIEMAAASGLALVPRLQRDPTRTSTLGTGLLLRAALDAGARRIVMGIGGSATNDGGCGMAEALGVRFLDVDGRVVRTPAGGMLERIDRIDVGGLDPRVAETRITVACDVCNPLTGPNGAAAVYGPQKGADEAMVAVLDRGLEHLARRWQRDLGVDVAAAPGAGAAGGLGGGLVAFIGARLEPGIQLVLEAVGFERRVAGCHLCLTGEGRLDGQSLAGKACLGVASAARRHGVPTIALVGAVGPDADRTLAAGLAAYRAIAPHLPGEQSMRRAAELIEMAAATVVEDRER